MLLFPDLNPLISGTGMILDITDNIQPIGEMKVEGTNNIQRIGTIGMVIGHHKEHIRPHPREIPLQEMRVQTEAEVHLTGAAAQTGAVAAVIHADKGIKMKNLLIITAVFLFLNFTGCYTVIWSPGMDFPTADKNSDYNSIDSTGYSSESDNYGNNYGDAYYNEPYYGPYAGYYNIPWWYSIAPPSVNKDNNKTNGKTATTKNGDVSPIRNSGDGRGNSGRNTGEIINTAPVSVSGSGSTSSGTNSNPKKSDSNSDNSRQSSGSGSVRNNDGNRNDGGRK
jgi:hypothetical protein